MPQHMPKPQLGCVSNGSILRLVGNSRYDRKNGGELPMKASTWTVVDATAKLSQVIERARSVGPQTIKHARTVEQVGGINTDEFTMLNKSLRRIERFWTDQISYRL